METEGRAPALVPIVGSHHCFTDHYLRNELMEKIDSRFYVLCLSLKTPCRKYTIVKHTNLY